MYVPFLGDVGRLVNSVCYCYNFILAGFIVLSRMMKSLSHIILFRMAIACLFVQTF